MPLQPLLDATTLAAVVDDVADAVVIVDTDAVIRYANRAVTALFGYEPGELVGAKYDMLVPPNFQMSHAAHHARYMAQPHARPMGEGLLLSARHADGYDVDVTIALVPIRSSSTMVAAFVRAVSTTQRLVDRLAATNEVLTAALSGESRRSVEQRATTSTCRVTTADSALLLSAPDDDSPLEVVASYGSDRWESVRDDIVGSGEFGELVSRPDGSASPPLRIAGPNAEYLVSPVRTAGSRGALVAGRSTGLPKFAEVDRQVLAEFADAVAITLELIEYRSEVDRLRSMADHDRIARDLHDRVIQRLFAIAMRLESAATGASDVAETRIVEAVDALDGVIREIRTTIFNLRRPEVKGAVRSAIAAEIDSVAEQLGFAPSLRIAGSIDDDVSDEVALEIPSVVRELLTNVVRHARAGSVDVSIRTDGERVTVTVDDDGTGLTRGPTSGQGLANLRDRASERDGSFDVIDRKPSGVRAVWTVPVAGAQGTTLEA